MNVFKGLHKGPFRVDGGTLLIRGVIHGSLRIDGDAEVEMRGMVRGDVLLMTGTLRLPGMVTGNIDNRGGRLYVSGVVQGKITTEASGTTVMESGTERAATQDGKRNT